MPTLHLDLQPDLIAEFCRTWRITEFSMFGSVLRDDFGPDSDVDVLVEFDPDAPWDAWDVLQAREQLHEMFGRPVDLVEKKCLRNPFRRHAILSTKQVIYARPGE